MNHYEQKDVRFEVKEIKEAGEFEGLASVYGNTDLGGDVVLPGAFTKSIKERGDKVPILWQHNSSQSIGRGTIEDSAKGLLVKGQLVLELPEAQSAYARLKHGLIEGMSIGYKSLPSRTTIEKGVRFLKEVVLYEVSLVTFPMNEMARVTSVKAEEFSLTEMEARTELALAMKAQYDEFLESKAGRTISKASRSRIEEAIKNLQALLEAEAVSDDTSDIQAPPKQYSIAPEYHSLLISDLNAKFKEILNV